jgi:tetratricopeptide (TPR) repeat protein
MPWTAFPYPDQAYVFDAAGLAGAWDQLHRGDAEPFPKKTALVDAWIAFHAGDFERARKLGLAAACAGYSVAHSASCVYASYVETDEARRLEIFQEVAERCERQKAEHPENPAGYYWQAYAIGRYAQRISIVKALARGLAPKVRAGLEQAIRLEPRHADAHFALGAYHAEIIGSVGGLVAGLTYGARKDDCYKAFLEGLQLDPGSAAGRIEYANALVLVEGKKKIDDARVLYREAAALVPRDAAERLEVEAAKSKLGNG